MDVVLLAGGQFGTLWWLERGTQWAGPLERDCLEMKNQQTQNGHALVTQESHGVAVAAAVSGLHQVIRRRKKMMVLMTRLWFRVVATKRYRL